MKVSERFRAVKVGKHSEMGDKERNEKEDQEVR